MKRSLLAAALFADALQAPEPRSPIVFGRGDADGVAEAQVGAPAKLA